MIFYSWIGEEWVSEDEDDTLRVGMTPEDTPDYELDREFKDWDEFYQWYYNDVQPE